MESRRFVPIQDLAASTIVCTGSTHEDHDYLLSLSCDTDGPEPEYWLRSNDDSALNDVWDEEDRMQQDIDLTQEEDERGTVDQ